MKIFVNEHYKEPVFDYMTASVIEALISDKETLESNIKTKIIIDVFGK